MPSGAKSVTDSPSALLLCLVSFTVAAAVMGASALWLNHGHFVYALDDGYISLAMARNLARGGTYGVSPGVYESASSSPLWVFLLAPFAWLGDRCMLLAPFVLNLLAAAWALASFAKLEILTLDAPKGASVLMAVLLPLSLFLPSLCFIGMEHTLHIAVCLYLFRQLRDGLADRPPAPLATALVAAALIRPEAAFVAGGLAVAHVVIAEPSRAGPAQRRIVTACVVLLLTVLPLAIVAVVNLCHGQYALANSIVAKTGIHLGGPEALLEPGARLKVINEDPMLFVIMIAVVGYLFVGRMGDKQSYSRPAIAFLVTFACQVAFGGHAGLPRYQAYLIALGAWTLLGAAGEVVAGRVEVRVRLFLAVSMLVIPLRKYGIEAAMPAGTNDIYRQHVSVARFLSTEYAGVPIAVRDLGVAAWMHRGPIVDLMGLGSVDVLRAWGSGRPMGPFFDEYLRNRGVQVVVCYEKDVPDPPPTSWVRVAEWTVPPRTRLVTLGEPTAVFFGVDPENAVRLHDRLVAFAPFLPDGVQVRYSSDHKS